MHEMMMLRERKKEESAKQEEQDLIEKEKQVAQSAVLARIIWLNSDGVVALRQNWRQRTRQRSASVSKVRALAVRLVVAAH